LEAQSNQQKISDLAKVPTPLVSVVCTTYNHANYIAHTLESLIRQNTTFPYEIIVHDDASTDGTGDIVREYERSYAGLIRTVLQSDNQYSKGGFKPAIYGASLSYARYIALCEGDDYWLDQNKLQLQADAMDLHPEVDFSFHSAYCSNGKELDNEPSWCYGSTRVLTTDEALGLKIGSFAPTCSYFFRRSLLDRLPSWFYTEAPMGDFFIERYGSLRGGALYLEQPLSVYHNVVSQSWTMRVQTDPSSYRRYITGMIKSLDLMDEDFSEYRERMNQVKAAMHLRYAICELYEGDFNQFKNSVADSVQCFRYISNKQRFAYLLRRFPKIFRTILSRKRQFDKV
jgi:glycosyltransferase involved in cell wall biosynthesis